ncbi:MAG: hypothetical protein L6R28_13145 [Planctomycetes bacterium]|nr:hypothetical protein [Planctomycetota bacterium]
MSRWNGLVLSVAGLVLLPSLASRAAEEPKDWEIPDPTKVEKKDGDGDKHEVKKDGGGDKHEWKKDGGGDKHEWKKDDGDGEHRDKPRGEAKELKSVPDELKGFGGQVYGEVMAKDNNFITFKVYEVAKVGEDWNKASKPYSIENTIIKIAPNQERNKVNQNHVAYLRAVEVGTKTGLFIKSHDSGGGFVLVELTWEQRKVAGLPVDGEHKDGGDRPKGKDGGDKPRGEGGDRR